MLNDKVEAARSGVSAGFGSVAKSVIRAGEVVWAPEVQYPLVSSAELSQLGQQEPPDLYSQVDVDLFAKNELEEWLLNHSCEPNCVMRNRTLVAVRGIAVGEELTYDYGLTETLSEWSFWCKCGRPDCRVFVCNRDYLGFGLRRKMKGRVPEHALIAASRASKVEVIGYYLRFVLYRLRYRVFADQSVPKWLRWVRWWS